MSGSYKNILFFYPSNARSVALETQLIELRKKGHKILILTTCEKGNFHSYMESIGFETWANKINAKGLFYYFRQIFFLINFCRKKNIDFVFSNLQHVNFISVLAQYFIKAKVVIFRHHFRYNNSDDKQIIVNKNEAFFDRVINLLAYKIIVPSSGVYNGMKQLEKVNIKKVHIIPYIYDFSKYEMPAASEIEKIKQLYPCRLRLIMVSRLIKLKRHHIVFPVIKDLLNEGYDIKMLVLDNGPEKENLSAYINENKLSESIIMLGYKTDFVNYMAASDLLIQPSLTDASNNVAKEMALFEKAIAVSKGVGDYDDYVIDNVNGYLIPPLTSSVYLREIIIDAYNNPQKLNMMGKSLKKEIVSKFDSSNSGGIMEQFEQFLYN
jgi:glycosyltransferase involved in cell wall biosynthesis